MRVFLAVLLFVTSASQGSPGVDTGQEAAVRKVVETYLQARERRDEKALRALFTEDADQLVSSGEWRKGREEIVRGTLGSSARTTGARTVTVQSVRFVSPDVAIADGPYEIAGDQTAAARRMWSSFVMTRAGGAWRISAIRNMLPAAPAR